MLLQYPGAFHTTTLLLMERSCLAGGIEAGGEFPDDIQLQIPPSSPIKTIGLSMHGTTIINN